MFKKSMVLLFVMAFMVFSFSAAFSGERGFARDLGKTAVAVEKCQSACEMAVKCSPDSGKIKAVKSQKCNMTECKCLNCVCGDNCAKPGCGNSCAKMAESVKNCACEKAAVKKFENKNCICAGGACAMKARTCGEKLKSACGISGKSVCKSGSCGESKMKAGKMNCKGGQCGK
ncbi:MAG: hypothetical protein A2008_01310 [Candidatus Wallbacteria bacterium GWC2_49_35]|uniref:Uncharacterized protein n=1 Tax=Candidatus Wallbacteria bacterium GWC2_49_35 TaxID=1817813 RepID=A0A1F7WQ47_9BACT|nr:MAG: hypothetical protein A2008_01310 [Candidatus Wallbacteria bacterium GWC2_49_35]